MADLNKTRTRVQDWIPVVIQLLGVAMLIFIVVFWAFTQHIDALIVGAGLTCMGGGYGLDGLQALGRVRREVEDQMTKRVP